MSLPKVDVSISVPFLLPNQQHQRTEGNMIRAESVKTEIETAILEETELKPKHRFRWGFQVDFEAALG